MYEGLLCVCCLSTEDLVPLFATGGGALHYSAMLAVCLRIPLSETDGHDYICTGCVDKLKDCIHFKKTALRSISMLSSLDLNELLSDEELQVLGLDGKETNFPHEEEPGPASAEGDELSAAAGKIKRKTIQISDSDSIHEDTAKNKTINTNKPKQERRGRGRPRTRSPGGLPYAVPRAERDCRECARTFPTHIALMVHYNSHFGRYACASCDAAFATRAGLRKHEQAHRPGPFRCDHCDQEFNKLNTLLSHKRYKHTAAGAAYRCGECGARFPTLHARLRHRAVLHAPAAAERRYACPYPPCDAAFTHSGERAKHVSRTHAVRWARCEQCGARVRHASLRAHQRVHARARAARRPRPQPRRFSCRLCARAFAQKHRALYHVRTHLRGGLYAAEYDPASLVADARARAARSGVFSDADSEQHLDESSLSDPEKGSLDDCELEYLSGVVHGPAGGVVHGPAGGDDAADEPDASCYGLDDQGTFDDGGYRVDMADTQDTSEQETQSSNKHNVDTTSDQIIGIGDMFERDVADEPYKIYANLDFSALLSD